jgi:TonB family protein
MLVRPLHARVMSRLQLPPGYEPRSPGDASDGVKEVQVKMEMDPEGKILDASIHRSSEAPELDRAVLTAIDKAACMPPAPAPMLDPRSKRYQLIVPYRFAPPR